MRARDAGGGNGRATWSPAEVPDAAEELIAQGYSPMIAALLAGRGVRTAADAQAFLFPSVDQLHDPLLLHGVEPALDLLARIRQQHGRVAIVGDYDVDGISGTAMLSAALSACGIENLALIPHRLRDGYGIQPLHVKRAQEAGCQLILTVDCGATAGETIRLALAEGLEVVVTDHHIPSNEFPDEAIQINPRQPGCDYPFKELAAVGLVLKLSCALLERFERRVPIASLLRAACLGTIADLVPLIGENRVIAALGLRALAEARSPGLTALLAVSGVKPPLKADDVGFRLGPRINAAGRLDSGEKALRLLLSRDSREAERLAQELDGWNQRRKDEEARVVEQAFEVFDSLAELPNLLVAWNPQWHRGVVGIAAGRLARHYHRPTLLLALEDDTATGSGRSISGLHLHGFLTSWRDQLIRFGGHAQAVGLTVAAEQLDPLKTAWLEAAESWNKELLKRHYRYEIRLNQAGAFDRNFYQELCRLEPFGQQNPSPLLRVGPLELLGRPRVFGKGHVKASAKGDDGGRLSMIGWRWEPRVGDLDGVIEVIGRASWDDFVGAPVLQLVDARPFQTE